MNLLAQWPSLHMPSTEICAEPTKLSLSTDLTHASEWASARKEPQTLRAAAECLLGPTASHPELQFLGINPAPALQVRTSQGKRANCRGVQLPIACCKACVVSNSSSPTTATQLTTLGHCRMSSAKLIRSSHIPQQGTGWRKQKGRDTANIIYQHCPGFPGLWNFKKHKVFLADPSAKHLTNELTKLEPGSKGQVH